VAWLCSREHANPFLSPGEKCKEVVQALKLALNRTETRFLISLCVLIWLGMRLLHDVYLSKFIYLYMHVQ
jgi:hypothetical protein